MDGLPNALVEPRIVVLDKLVELGLGADVLPTAALLEKVRAAFRMDSRTGQSQPTSMWAWPMAVHFKAEPRARSAQRGASTLRASPAREGSPR